MYISTKHSVLWQFFYNNEVLPTSQTETGIGIFKGIRFRAKQNLSTRCYPFYFLYTIYVLIFYNKINLLYINHHLQHTINQIRKKWNQRVKASQITSNICGIIISFVCSFGSFGLLASSLFGMYGPTNILPHRLITKSVLSLLAFASRCRGFVLNFGGPLLTVIIK